jgi:hypothetical protein
MRHTINRVSVLAIALGIALSFAGTATATLVTTPTDVYLGTTANWGDTEADLETAWGGVPVDAANDLLKNHLSASPTYPAVPGMSFGSSLSNINDGVIISNGGTLGSTADLAAFAPGGDLVFNLDGLYNISRIDSFTAHNAKRVGQKYTLSTSTDGGSTWSVLTSVNYDNGSSANLYMREVSLTGSAGGPIAMGVNALKFTISDPSGGDGTAVYGEIAAYGSPVPEPASVILLLSGAISLLAYAWRKRK